MYIPYQTWDKKCNDMIQFLQELTEFGLMSQQTRSWLLDVHSHFYLLITISIKCLHCFMTQHILLQKSLLPRPKTRHLVSWLGAGMSCLSCHSFWFTGQLIIWRIWPSRRLYAIYYMDGLVQDYSNSRALAMELLLSCTKRYNIWSSLSSLSDTYKQFSNLTSDWLAAQLSPNLTSDWLAAQLSVNQRHC